MQDDQRPPEQMPPETDGKVVQLTQFQQPKPASNPPPKAQQSEQKPPQPPKQKPEKQLDNRDDNRQREQLAKAIFEIQASAKATQAAVAKIQTAIGDMQRSLQTQEKSLKIQDETITTLAGVVGGSQKDLEKKLSGMVASIKAGQSEAVKALEYGHQMARVFAADPRTKARAEQMMAKDGSGSANPLAKSGHGLGAGKLFSLMVGAGVVVFVLAAWAF